ncbi:ATP-binding cassette domain-containing protein [Kitasatospora sp. LaBMicrA B282]|uniref:ATP-binding cassette domain-containing protein n=1 Tax=Kitasatospora sp. LaBMicrA B282 TaxID=3420949 RepID=UPI003D0E95FC
MIQVNGLTKVYRRGRRPALLDLGFDTGPSTVTALLGTEGAGKTTALRLMVELERGKGVTLFDGRPYRKLRRPEREVGVLLPTAHRQPGSLGRTARDHLRMLAVQLGAPVRRADELLEQTRLAGVAEHRLRTFSPGMVRRLALAAALLGSPRALLLDAPAEGLSPRNAEWLHAFVRAFSAGEGCCVVVTTRSPQEAAQLADRVVTLDAGRVVADQPVAEFRRTRLHPEVAVRGPQMARLADLLLAQGAQVRQDGSARLAVSGLGRTEIGELAYRSGILLHELADRVVEQPPPRAGFPVAVRGGGIPAVRVRRDAPSSTGVRAAAVPTGRPGAEAQPLPPGPPTIPLPPVPSAAPVAAAARVPAGASPSGTVTAPPGSAGATAASAAPALVTNAAPAPIPTAPTPEPIPQPLTGPDHWNG